MNAPLRILYYNWVDYLDAEGRGGGVTLYQRNVIQSLAARDDVEVTFLASGLSYDLPARAPRWEALRHGPQKGQTPPRYEMINSGVLAPSHFSFGDPAQVTHDATRLAFFDFVEGTGPYDVIHFNNLEGLPADVLRIKEHCPDTRVVFSLHNYYPICPQVNLWFAETQTCTDFQDGAACDQCLLHHPDRRLLRVAGGLSYRLRRAGLEPGSRTYDILYRGIMGLGRRALKGLHWLRKGRDQGAKFPVIEPKANATRAAAFKDRRATMTALINAHCDEVLCVSDAVRVLAIDYGLDPALCRTDYIGTQAAEVFAQTKPDPAALTKQTLTLGYLGYMRRDKGFFFLLDALEALPVSLAQHLHIVIAARAGDKPTMARVKALEAHLAGITYHDGYTHAELDRVLKPVDVGIVPVLWHDNLPQVAIEMHARHIPLLCADMGGASEMGRHPDMTFTAGDVTDFTTRLARLMADQVALDDYWQGAMTPVTMHTHVEGLLEGYTQATDPAAP